MTEQKPLWEVMQSAYIAGCKPGCGYRRGYAAEIRAIALEIAQRDPDNTMSALAVEEWLLGEAERAEGSREGLYGLHTHTPRKINSNGP
jgi:hypothetical protein